MCQAGIKEKHDIAREPFLNWMRHGKLKMGVLFENMKGLVQFLN